MGWTAECLGDLVLLLRHCGPAAVHAGAGGRAHGLWHVSEWQQPMRSGEMGHMTK